MMAMIVRHRRPIMSGDVKGFVVALSADMDEGVANELMKAIGLMRGVISVKPVHESADDCIISERVNAEWRERVRGLLKS
jgi:hypothetical protein